MKVAEKPCHNIAKQYLGLGKTKFNSSTCFIDDNSKTTEIFLTERLSRQKASGLWPENSLKVLIDRTDLERLTMAENGDVNLPRTIEDLKDQEFPFYDYLKKKKLDIFTSKFNPNIQFISHHKCHAYAALAMSPFEKSIILVMDGAGNGEKNTYEECSVFLQNGMMLTEVQKRWVTFTRAGENFLGNRTGAMYEKVAEFIFHSPHSSGKVMGLASFGKPEKIKDIFAFQEKLNWNNAYRGKLKKEWETSKHMSEYVQIAADVQAALEDDYLKIILEIKKQYPDYENLILVGGCALNCTNNAKILNLKLFKTIYVPPFPGDESIAFGAAHFLKYQTCPDSWQALAFENQSGYLGPVSSSPMDAEIEKIFSSQQFKLCRCDDIESVAANLLVEGKILAWFQGRSESGPRALGNRSILVRPDRSGIKDYLNMHVKFRESFRPYGCSVLHEFASTYFEVDPDFNNPYMSFAIKVKNEWKEKLLEVTHIDGTSRMQTVREGQNAKFYSLIKKFGEISGIFCLLNTSLNVMNEPIVETIEDAKRFLINANIDALVVGNYLIQDLDKRRDLF